MKQKQSYLIILIILSQLSVAQSIESSAVNAAGSTISNDVLTLNFNLGTVAIGYHVTPKITVEEGFLHAQDEEVLRAELIDPFIVNVYPNPTSEILNVIVPEQGKAATISLFDPTGIAVRIIEYQQGNTHIQLDLSELPSGIYYLLTKRDGKSNQNMHKIMLKH